MRHHPALREEGLVVTVSGPTMPARLGVTLTHEHVFADLTGYYEEPDDPVAAVELTGPVQPHMRGHLAYHDCWNRDNLLLDDPALAVRELRHFVSRGGGTVCDVSSRGIRIDRLLAQLPAVADGAGVTLIVGSGCYVASHHEPFVASASVAELARLFVGEIVEGISDTGVRAGILGELGLSTPPSPAEWRVLRAAARAHRSTGAPLVIHQGDLERFRIPHMALDLLAEESVAPQRVVIGHANFNPGTAAVRSVLDRGAFVAFDHFGMSGYERRINWQLPPERNYVDQVVELVRAGYGDRILLSHDVCAKTHLRTFGGHGYGHLLGVVTTMFQRAGLAEEELATMMVANAATVLSLSR